MTNLKDKILVNVFSNTKIVKNFSWLWFKKTKERKH